MRFCEIPSVSPVPSSNCGCISSSFRPNRHWLLYDFHISLSPTLQSDWKSQLLSAFTSVDNSSLSQTVFDLAVSPRFLCIPLWLYLKSSGFAAYCRGGGGLGRGLAYLSVQLRYQQLDVVERLCGVEVHIGNMKEGDGGKREGWTANID